VWGGGPADVGGGLNDEAAPPIVGWVAGWPGQGAVLLHFLGPRCMQPGPIQI
jgi:hypothetical protein